MKLFSVRPNVSSHSVLKVNPTDGLFTNIDISMYVNGKKKILSQLIAIANI